MTPEREAAIRALVRDHARTTPHVCVDEKEYPDGCLYLVCAGVDLLKEVDALRTELQDVKGNLGQWRDASRKGLCY